MAVGFFCHQPLYRHGDQGKAKTPSSRIGSAKGTQGNPAQGRYSQACRVPHASTLLCHSLKGGYDIKTVQELLGHKDMTITMVYTHVLNRAAGEFLARLIPC